MTAQTDWKLEPDDQSERLYSLTLALVQTEYGLTKDEIFTSIRGYRLDLEKAGGFGGDLTALNKKFDRDKEKLRELGVQIIPSQNSNEGDADYRYQISREIFTWPQGATLTARQFQLLDLAASIWDRAALSPEAQNAITRLRALSQVGNSTTNLSISPRVNAIEPSFGPLKRAIDEQVVVSFRYRKPDGQESTRVVAPWQLSLIGGVWMLLGYDYDRKETRNFLLRRIHSNLTKTKEVYEIASSSALSKAKSDLDSVFEKNVALLKVAPGSTASMHFETQHSENGLVQVHFYDLELFTEEILEFGGSVRVIEPASLVDSVKQTLKRVIAQHA